MRSQCLLYTSPTFYIMADKTVNDCCLIILIILLPPLGVFLMVGLHVDFWINLLLTILGYFPGHIHAFYVMIKDRERYKATKVYTTPQPAQGGAYYDKPPAAAPPAAAAPTAPAAAVPASSTVPVNHAGAGQYTSGGYNEKTL
ncbi:hypothetical protein BCR43DRAFT_551908 [Syncephalastrum racemosum]|uniref:Uncharacterized protein n=1 Tax=Syncephalastrum racemosum TaxID=13706 RepID=A0A1X2H6K6_SYNRA|nr:hypothetical protein BCR43DRAFT_551908 [Syncephalastrum racemosum]